MKSFLVLTIAAFTFSEAALANGIEKRLFTMDKSYNPENILVINARVDNNCKFVSSNNAYMEFYWLMNRTTRKEVHPTIKKEITQKVQFAGINAQRDLFQVRMNDLSELKHDLENVTMEVSSEIANGNCVVKSIIKLGPSAQYRRLNLKRTYCDVTTNMLGLPNGCKYIDLEGLDADNNTPLKVRFKGK